MFILQRLSDWRLKPAYKVARYLPHECALLAGEGEARVLVTPIALFVMEGARVVHTVAFACERADIALAIESLDCELLPALALSAWIES